MRTRVLPVVGFFGLAVAAAFWQKNVSAQDLYVTNLNQLVSEAYSGEHCYYFAYLPLPWWAYSIDGSEPWWVDCSQFDCTDLLVAPTNLVSGVTAYGVVLTGNLSTGETTLQPLGSTDVVATAAAPTGFVPGADPEDAATWRFYQQILDCPDCYGFDGEVPPPEIKLNAFLANANDYATYATYESNLDAEAEATASSAMSLGGGFMAMDDDEDDGGGDPCTLTNLLQAFYVTNIVHNATGSTTITWESCQYFRYLVFTASSLSTNTQWVPQAYVWGQANASWTTWTDAATTNDDGSTITQRFYRVQRILGSPIAAGGESSVALRPDGTLWAWGNNDGNLGDGLDSGITRADSSFVEQYLPYPSDVAGAASCGVQTITNATVVAAGGDDYTVVVDATGTVWTFGENTQGQLGNLGTDGPLYPIPTPIIGVAGFSNIVTVAAGYQHTLALRADGAVFAWGQDQYGYDGNEGVQGVGNLLSGIGSTNSPIESLIPTNTFIVAIAAGNGFSLAVDTTGLVWGWGDDAFGEIGTNGVGTGGDPGTNLPVQVPGISNVIAIAAGDNYAGSSGGGHSIALTSAKQVWTWGDNEFGQLGRGTLTYDPTPRVVAALTNQNIVAIAGGVGFTLAVTSNGLVYAWGDNTYGELGTNTSAVALTNLPTLVSGISNAVWVSAPRSDDALDSIITTNYNYAGGVHSLAMTLDPVDGTGQKTNNYWGWGDNAYGQVGNVTNGGGTNQISQYTPAGPLQFCTRCQREVQLGTSGSFTAQCNGTLYLFFNASFFFGASGSYSAMFNGSSVTVQANNEGGVPVGTVTNGGAYTYSATGTCFYSGSSLSGTDANGNSTTNMPPDCSNFDSINITNAPCPFDTCFSLVGRIQ